MGVDYGRLKNVHRLTRVPVEPNNDILAMSLILFMQAVSTSACFSSRGDVCGTGIYVFGSKKQHSFCSLGCDMILVEGYLLRD